MIAKKRKERFAQQTGKPATAVATPKEEPFESLKAPAKAALFITATGHRMALLWQKIHTRFSPPTGIHSIAARIEQLRAKVPSQLAPTWFKQAKQSMGHLCSASHSYLNTALPLILRQCHSITTRITPFCCRLGWRWPLAITTVVLLISLLGNESLVSANTRSPIHQESLSAALPLQLSEKSDAQTHRSTTIHAGDSISNALERLGLPIRDALAIARASQSTYPLTKIRPGQKLTRTDSDSGIQLAMALDATRSLHIIQADNQSWHTRIITRHTTHRWLTRSGTIHNNLFLDASRAGLDDHTTMNLVNIFAWDIDFARNLRRGDSFSVILDEIFDDQGKRIGHTILAAEFINRGKVYRAIRFTDNQGVSAYYAPNGTSMRKNYLKAAVKFTRISSRFSVARMHPILGYTRAHRGVDYAAPTGTPIHAIGAGKIIVRRRTHGYGNFIVIRHRNRHHSSAYGHMHNFAKGLHVGSWVKQGQVIGYVGMTGLATGPHLHFEFRIDGKAINPLLMKRIPARPIPHQLRAKFKRQSHQRLLALKQQSSPTSLAWQ